MKIPDSRKIYNHLKSSAKRRGIDFSLSLADINNMSYPITCPVFGCKLIWGSGLKDDSATFDRIDSSLGYSFDNLWIISWKANRCKNNLSLADLKIIGEFYSRVF